MDNCTRMIPYFAALPKIEHRAENSPSGNDWSKYYEKFREYLQNDHINNYFKPDSSASSASNEVQADSQADSSQSSYGIDFNQYQNGLNGMNGQSFQQYQNYFKNPQFKECMSQYGAPNFNFPSSLSEASGNSGYGSGSGSGSSSGSSSSSSSSSNNYDPNHFREAFRKCQQSVQSSFSGSNGYQFPNFNNPFTASSSSGSNGAPAST